LKAKDILQQRLTNQQLISKDYKAVGDLVKWMGALQAQDYAMAKWAIGLRLNNFSDDDIEASINAGDIFRVHTLRPTWHFVAAEDLRWMMSLTAPNIKRMMATQNRQIGLTDVIFRKCQKIILKLLSDGKPRTREEIVSQIKAKGISLDNLQATNVMIYAELDLIVCNGPRREKQFTYTLCEERVPTSKPLSREDALYKLTRTYFRSHGPATAKDFAWWSGLAKDDLKRCIEMVTSEFNVVVIEDHKYFYDDSVSTPSSRNNSIILLPPYDEFTVGYANRDLISGTSETEKLFFGPLIFRPVIVSSGKAIGTWRREVAKELVIETEFHGPLSLATKKKVKAAAAKYQKFINKPLAKLQF
jgi:hypothetical protein